MLLIDRCQQPRQTVDWLLVSPAQPVFTDSSLCHFTAVAHGRMKSPLKPSGPDPFRPPTEPLLIIMTNIIYANVIRGRREHDRRAQGAAGNSPGSKHSIKILNSTRFNLSVINKAAVVFGGAAVKFHHRPSTCRRRERERDGDGA